MPPRVDSDSGGLKKDLLDRFLTDCPEGTAGEMDRWAKGQAALRADGKLTEELQRMLRCYHWSRELLPGSNEGEVGEAERKFFRRGGIRAVDDEVSSQIRAEEAASSTSVAALKEGSRVGHFRLTRFIAKGGMGQVWEAHDENLRKAVALKLVLPNRVDQRSLDLFAREARAGGRLAHPNIVATLAHGTDHHLTWIAQELVPGSWTLKDSIAHFISAESIPGDYYREVAELVAQLALGLQAAHTAGVIHRDVKPQNILIDDNDRPKLTDFGLAQVTDDSFQSVSGDIAGTWAYMSPEQVTAKRIGLDHRSDIFSLGIVLYELLTLRRPFFGDTSHQIAQRIVTYDPPDPTRVRSQCPKELAVICCKTLEKDPARRYSQMQELADDLRRHLANEPIRARPPGWIVRGTKWIQRHPAKAVAVAIGVLAMVAITGLSVLAMGKAKDAQEQKTLAQANEEEARVHAQDVMRLSAAQTLTDLVAEADALWPARPEFIGDFQDWIKRARELTGGLSMHRAKRTELRAHASFDQATASWIFPPAKSQERWWDGQLTRLIDGLERLQGDFLDPQAMTPTHGWSVLRRLEFSKEVAEESLTGSLARERWRNTDQYLATADVYSGLTLKPQIGLLPLGPDPVSGLLEFAHLSTGDVALRGTDGHLILSEETGVVLVLIPPGEFVMGAQAGDPSGVNYDQQAQENEGPPHRVSQSAHFLSKYEMTQGQWLRATGENPSYFNPGTELAPSLLHPVEQVSWDDCFRVLPWVGLELPSEALWEYATRGGTSGPWWTGVNKDSLRGKANLADQAAKEAGVLWPGAVVWADLNDGGAAHTEAGRYEANPFGLHDVIGNLWEWCIDGYVDSFEGQADGALHRIDPVLSSEGVVTRVTRGGSFNLDAGSARSAARSGNPPENRGYALGVRPARRIQ